MALIEKLFRCFLKQKSCLPEDVLEMEVATEKAIKELDFKIEAFEKAYLDGDDELFLSGDSR